MGALESVGVILLQLYKYPSVVGAVTVYSTGGPPGTRARTVGPQTTRGSRPADYHDHYDDFQEEGTRVTPARLRAQIHKLLQDTDIKITEFPGSETRNAE